MIERESTDKKTCETSQERVYGITSTPADQTSPEKILADNRGHWGVESCHYIIDWNYDEDRSQIRTGVSGYINPRIYGEPITSVKASTTEGAPTSSFLFAQAI